MKLYYGASHNPEEIITTHLFIICANNSGTTFLKNALATSHRTWNLMREGQHTFGFAGPNEISEGAYKCWASEQHRIDMFTNPANYDWKSIKQAWYFQAFSRNSQATVFVEKSPPFLLIVNQLFEQFRNARFLFMVRNPYAVVEGIRRKAERLWRDFVPAEDVVSLAATQVINCLVYQRDNIERWGKYSVFFTYEQMCEAPEETQEQIKNLVPELDDLILRQRLPVKDYDENLRNMNAQQIERLTEDDRQQINKIFSHHQDVLNFFQYPLSI